MQKALQKTNAPTTAGGASASRAPKGAAHKEGGASARGITKAGTRGTKRGREEVNQLLPIGASA